MRVDYTFVKQPHNFLPRHVFKQAFREVWLVDLGQLIYCKLVSIDEKQHFRVTVSMVKDSLLVSAGVQVVSNYLNC
jgi:hypothetical protein